MDTFADAALSFLERCGSYSALDELMADFGQVLAAFGFNRFMMTRLSGLNEDAEPLILAHTWSEDWGNRYREKRYLWHDPVTQFSYAHHQPFTWAEARAGSRRTRMALAIASEAKSVGMVDGIGFPMSDPTAAQAVVSLSADHIVDLTAKHRVLLQMVCICCETRASELIGAKAVPIIQLTPREREVLRWIASGKTVDDTSDILATSARTIEEHLVHARQKLGASNTTQAVARALYWRQITP